MKWRIMAVAIALLVLAGCGGGDDDAVPAGPSIDQAEVDASNYTDAYMICGAALRGEITHENIDVDPAIQPAAFADEYAAGYRVEARQAPFDGCLDALEGRPESPPG
jgi:hypothetical protein